MSADGIWSTEVLGVFGWESTGILVLDQGRAIDGGNHHYSTGRYAVRDGHIRISLAVEYYGTPRTIFGAADKTLNVEINGHLAGGTIEGSAHRLDRPDQKATIKLIRRSALPPCE